MRSRKSLVNLVKEHACSSATCWESEKFLDGGVEAIVGSGWKCFMAERHFTDNACGTVGRTEGGYCDAIAAHQQASSRRLKVIEVKTQAKFPHAKSQLRKGVQFALGLPAVSADAVAVELHVKEAPKITVRPQQRSLLVGTRLFSIQLVVAGQPQFA